MTVHDVFSSVDVRTGNAQGSVSVVAQDMRVPALDAGSSTNCLADELRDGHMRDHQTNEGTQDTKEGDTESETEKEKECLVSSSLKPF